MSQDVIVDALPYIDTGYDEPGVREAVSIFSNLTYELLVVFIHYFTTE